VLTLTKMYGIIYTTKENKIIRNKLNAKAYRRNCFWNKFKQRLSVFFYDRVFDKAFKKSEISFAETNLYQDGGLVASGHIWRSEFRSCYWWLEFNAFL